MILSLLFPILAIGRGLEGLEKGGDEVRYGPTAFDDLLGGAPPGDLGGYTTNHDKKRANKGFGHLSLVDYNMETDDDFNREHLIDAVWDVVDSAHPTILALQSVKRRELDVLVTKSLGHYGAVNKTDGSIDMLSSAMTYLPIFYDTKVLKLMKSGYYHDPREKKIIYASWAVFEHKETKRWFTIINLDLFSAFADNTDVQMMNILADVKKEHIVDSNPIFFMGNINAISPKLQKVFDDEYVNPLDTDLNAKDSPKFTMRIPVDISNNHQRDFIFIRDASHSIKVNYARILRKDILTSHYPIHGIFTFVGGGKGTIEDKEPEDRKNNERKDSIGRNEAKDMRMIEEDMRMAEKDRRVTEERLRMTEEELRRAEETRLKAEEERRRVEKELGVR